MKYSHLTKDFILSLLSYDKETGNFYWKLNADKSNKRYAGTKANYRQIKIREGSSLYSIPTVKLVWFIETGEWCEVPIRFRTSDKKNTHINNLVRADASKVQPYRAKHKNNSSGCTGVSKHNGGWQVRGYRDKYIGLYKTKEEAIAANNKAS